MNQPLTSQKGLSILEILVSLAIMSVALAGFLEASKVPILTQKRQLHRQDLSMIRYFVLNNFSCEDSLTKVNGTYTCPSNPATFVAKNHMGESFASGTGLNFGLTAAGKEPFQLTAQCITEGKQIRVSFSAKHNGINPITGKLYSDTASLLVYKDANRDNVNQGNDVVCTPPPPVTAPTSDICSVNLVDYSDGSPEVKIPGIYFRDPNAMGTTKWSHIYEKRPRYFSWRVLVSGEDAATYGDDNKPDAFQIQFVLKEPKSSISEYRRLRGERSKKIADDPDSDQYAAGGKPLPGETFTLDACTGSFCSFSKKDIIVVQKEDLVPPMCRKSNSKVSSASKDMFCNNTYYWQADIPVSAIHSSSRKDGEDDWYDSAVDMKLVAQRKISSTGYVDIASCSTTFNLISPLVLVWPETNDGAANDTKRLVPTTTHFDLDGDGTKDQIGWVSGQAGFLALDLNKNGQVDSGHELFGDATVVGPGIGHVADNGFEALRQYDANRDGVMDRLDPVFSDLLVWFDRNGNGTTEPWEAVPLKLMGIENIELTYKKVQNPPEGSNPYVKARLEARFHGQQRCGQDGCPVYDLYFVKL